MSSWLEPRRWHTKPSRPRSTRMGRLMSLRVNNSSPPAEEGAWAAPAPLSSAGLEPGPAGHRLAGCCGQEPNPAEPRRPYCARCSGSAWASPETLKEEAPWGLTHGGPGGSPTKSLMAASCPFFFMHT